MGVIVTGTQESFEAEVLRADLPVLVDFSAPWCAPCRAMEPTIEEIAREQAGKLKIVRISVDESPGVATRYHVQSLPTVIVFLAGRPVGSLTGLMSKERLMLRLGDHLQNR